MFMRGLETHGSGSGVDEVERARGQLAQGLPALLLFAPLVVQVPALLLSAHSLVYWKSGAAQLPPFD